RPVAERLLEIRDRADDLVDGAALADGVAGELLTSEEASRLLLMTPARLPALEQTVVDGDTHRLGIGISPPGVERPRGWAESSLASSPPARHDPGGQAVSYL